MGEWDTAYSLAASVAQGDDFLFRQLSATPPAAGTVRRATAAQVGALASADIPRVMFFGTSNVSGYQAVEGGERWTDKVCASLHAEQVNYGATGAILDLDATSSQGGYSTVWNALTPRVAGAGVYTVRHAAPYVPLSPVTVLDFGFNDLAWLSSSVSTSITWWSMAMQACACVARAGGWFPDSDASVVYGGSGGSHWTAYFNQQQYSWVTSHGTSTVGDTATITTPADFPGGEVCLYGAPFGGGAKWSTTVDGGTPLVQDGTSARWGSQSGHGSMTVQRLQGLSAGAHTIVTTLAAIDGGGTIAIFGGWSITSPDLPLTVLVNSPSVPGLPVAAGGAPHTPVTAADVASLNAAFSGITSQFTDGLVITADIAGALSAAGCNVVYTSPGSGYASDNQHLNAHGHTVAAQAVLAAIRSAPLPGLGRYSGMGLLMRIIGGPLEPGLSANWSVTGGGAAWIGTDRAGNTVARLQLTKSSAGVVNENIFPLTPGIQPSSNVVLTGVTTAGAPAALMATANGFVNWLAGDPTAGISVSGSWPANGPGS